MLRLLLRVQSVMPFYAVANGKNIGIYHNWADCEQQVKGFSSAKYKKFNTEQEASNYISGLPPKPKVFNPKTLNVPSTAKTSGTTSTCTQSYCTKSTDATQPLDQNKQECVEKEEDYPYLNITAVKQVDYVNVYTDGASSNNGRDSAVAGIGVYWGPKNQWNVSERLKGRQTNNRAEIQAACKAINQAHTRGIKKLRVYTDSQFLINSYTKWLPGWKRNGWKLSTGGPVKNRVDFEELEEIIEDLDVKFVHVRGHSGDVSNDAADKLAVAGAKKLYLHKRATRDPASDKYDT